LSAPRARAGFADGVFNDQVRVIVARKGSTWVLLHMTRGPDRSLVYQAVVGSARELDWAVRRPYPFNDRLRAASATVVNTQEFALGCRRGRARLAPGGRRAGRDGPAGPVLGLRLGGRTGAGALAAGPSGGCSGAAGAGPGRWIGPRRDRGDEGRRRLGPGRRHRPLLRRRRGRERAGQRGPDSLHRRQSAGGAACVVRPDLRRGRLL